MSTATCARHTDASLDREWLEYQMKEKYWKPLWLHEIGLEGWTLYMSVDRSTKNVKLLPSAKPDKDLKGQC